MDCTFTGFCLVAQKMRKAKTGASAAHRRAVHHTEQKEKGRHGSKAKLMARHGWGKAGG
jgi:hypothetical protein